MDKDELEKQKRGVVGSESSRLCCLNNGLCEALEKLLDTLRTLRDSFSFFFIVTVIIVPSNLHSPYTVSSFIRFLSISLLHELYITGFFCPSFSSFVTIQETWTDIHGGQCLTQKSLSLSLSPSLYLCKLLTSSWMCLGYCSLLFFSCLSFSSFIHIFRPLCLFTPCRSHSPPFPSLDVNI